MYIAALRPLKNCVIIFYWTLTRHSIAIKLCVSTANGTNGVSDPIPVWLFDRDGPITHSSCHLADTNLLQRWQRNSSKVVPSSRFVLLVSDRLISQPPVCLCPKIEQRNFIAKKLRTIRCLPTTGRIQSPCCRDKLPTAVNGSSQSLPVH